MVDRIQSKTKCDRAYTPGAFGRAQPTPQETAPKILPLQARGPPLSPWQESIGPLPLRLLAQTMEGVIILLLYWEFRTQSWLLIVLTWANCKVRAKLPPSLSLPQPLIVHIVPGLTSDVGRGRALTQLFVVKADVNSNKAMSKSRF